MTWQEWKFSSRLAWRDRFMRVTTGLTVVLLVSTSGYFLFRLLPTGWKTGAVVMHYNIYLGIDEVRPWPWIFLIPGAALLLTLIDLSFSLGLFRTDHLASRVIAAVGLISITLWSIGSFFLVIVNT